MAKKKLVKKKTVTVKAKLKVKPKPKAVPKLKVKPKAKAVSKVKAKAKPVKKAVAKKQIAKKAKTPIKKTVPVKKTKPTQTVKAKASSVKIDYTKAITPLADRLVIRLVQAEKMSKGGLYLPDSVTSTTGYLKGEVLAAGQGTYSKKGHHKQLDVKIGDTVLFSEYSSTQVKFNNEELHIVHENDVLGVTK